MMEPQPIWLSVLITFLHGGMAVYMLFLLVAEAWIWLWRRGRKVGRAPVNDVPSPTFAAADLAVREATHRRELEQLLHARVRARAQTGGAAAASANARPSLREVSPERSEGSDR